MLGSFLRFLCLGLVRLFYARIHVIGREHVPSEGPVIVVSNHVNGLVDPMVLRMAIARPVAFLAKSTLFGNFVARQAMAAFGAIPVYRAKEADTMQNRRTFDLAHALLKNNGWLALFPEGVSHNEPVMQPLKTGAARIALAAEAKADFMLGVKILPIGLSYDAKETFRSGASATVGEPFVFTDLKAQYDSSARNTAQVLTERIAERLADVVLQNEDRELWQGFRFVARWMQHRDDDDLARRLSQAYRKLCVDDPARAAALVEEARAFARAVRSVGIDDPRALQVRLSASKLAALVLGLPIALLGALLAYLPYRATGPIARKLAGKEDDLVSTFKALAGFVFLSSTYIVEALAAGWLWGAEWGGFTLLAAPLTGFIAMRYGELLQLLKQVTRTRLLEEIRERRATLVAHMSKELVHTAS